MKCKGKALHKVQNVILKSTDLKLKAIDSHHGVGEWIFAIYSTPIQEMQQHHRLFLT